MKAWKLILIVFFLISIAFILGFYSGFQEGYKQGEKLWMEGCGFYFDPTTNTYYRDITHINLNFTNISNGT